MTLAVQGKDCCKATSKAFLLPVAKRRSHACQEPPAVSCVAVMLAALKASWGQLAGWALQVAIPVDKDWTVDGSTRVQARESCLP